MTTTHTDAPDTVLPELHLMTKVEVVVNGSEVADVRAIFDQAGITGFTMLGNVAGMGHAGFHEGRLAFNDRDGLTMLITVVRPHLAARLVERLRVLLAERPGVMFVSDTRVSRLDYFTT
jgi:nitrogen regulatory protein PII